MAAATARRVVAALLASSASLLLAGPAAAQGVRITGTSTARYVELRPLVDDSVPVAQTSGEGPFRTLANGQLVQCVGDEPFCRFKRSGARESSIPLLQDLSLTAWGLGRGLSIHAAGRGRTATGTYKELWPRSTDRFDLLEGYLQYDRANLTGRLGRQWAQSGLGVYNYDGLSLALRPVRWLRAEAYGGRSLLQGTNEPYLSSELAAVEELPPDQNAFLVGGGVQLRPTNATAIRGVYERVVRNDRSGLYSERIATDASWRLPHAMLEGGWQHDLATNRIIEGRVRGRAELPWRTSLTLEARRSRPFFELWTIWGAFSPVGFDEARADLGWRTRGLALSVAAHGAYRQWEDTYTGLASQPLRGTGWRAGADGHWRATRTLGVSGSYDADVGFGASRGDGTLGITWQPNDRLFFGATGNAWQSIYELRVGTERVVGGVVDAGIRLRPDLRLVGDVGLWKSDVRDRPSETDWSQRRATLRLEWAVGDDPGMGLPAPRRRPW